MLQFWKILKKSFVGAYEQLAFTIICSSLFLGVMLICLSILKQIPYGRLMPVFACGCLLMYILVLAPIIAGSCALARSLISYGDETVRDLFAHIRKSMISAWKLGLLQVIITLVLAVNIWFYFTHGGMVFKIIGVVFIYIAFFWFASMIYHFPILAEQHTGALLTLKRGFLLELDNIGFTALMFFVIILFTGICVATFVGLAFIYLGVMSLLTTNLTRALFVKYNLLPDEEPKEIGDDGFPHIG